jgi:outer membrane murein-binding lipoprotein Lpp
MGWKGGDLPTQAQFDELSGILWGLNTSLQNLVTKFECLATTVKNLAASLQNLTPKVERLATTVKILATNEQVAALPYTT